MADFCAARVIRCKTFFCLKEFYLEFFPLQMLIFKSCLKKLVLPFIGPRFSFLQQVGCACARLSANSIPISTSSSDHPQSVCLSIHLACCSSPYSVQLVLRYFAERVPGTGGVFELLIINNNKPWLSHLFFNKLRIGTKFVVTITMTMFTIGQAIPPQN